METITDIQNPYSGVLPDTGSTYRFPFPEDDPIVQAYTDPKHYESFLIKATGGVVKTTKSGKMYVEGECTNNSRDVQGENIHSLGIEVRYALRDGKLLWGHTPEERQIDPLCVLGIPLKLEPGANGLYIFGMFYDKQPYARTLYDIMEANPGSHGIKWSIEGGSIFRDPADRSQVLKSFLKNICLDYNVVNTLTWADVVKKSLNAMFKALTASPGNGTSAAAVIPENLSNILTTQAFGPYTFNDKQIPNFNEDDYFDVINGKKWFKSAHHGRRFFQEICGLSRSDALDRLRNLLDVFFKIQRREE